MLLVFACLHLSFAVSFALKTPYRAGGFVFSQPTGRGTYQHIDDIGAPDERQHANVIAFILNEHKLPVLNPKSPNLVEEYQAHQPPLFYTTAAVISTITGQTDVESQSFGRVIRILNCIIGALGVVGVFFAALWSTRREDIALIAGAFAAFLPMNCALSGAISNDPLLIALIAWSFAYASRAFNADGAPDTKRSLVLAAVFTGLACITKSSGLVAMAGLFVTLLALRPKISMKALSGFAVIALVIALPVWIRNQIIYGDPLAQNVFKQAFEGTTGKIMAVIEASNAPG